MIRDNRTGTSTDEQSILAIERASLEWLCSVRMFLPCPGLDAIAPALEAEGFCFRSYDQVLTMALFPDGWSLTPVSTEPWQRSLFAYLTDPSGAVRARVFYRDTSMSASPRSPRPAAGIKRRETDGPGPPAGRWRRHQRPSRLRLRVRLAPQSARRPPQVNLRVAGARSHGSRAGPAERGMKPMPESPVNLVTTRDITAAIRGLYPHIRKLSTEAQEDGTFAVQIPAATARYWGIGRDHAYAAAWLSRRLGRHATITAAEFTRSVDGDRALVRITVDNGPLPADPGSSRGIPVYETVDQVIGGFPANRIVRGLIQAAISASLRPHLAPERSRRGPRYRVMLWSTAEATPLVGCFDVTEAGGRFVRAWLAWGRGDEQPYDKPAEVRALMAQSRAAVEVADELAGHRGRKDRAGIPADRLGSARPGRQAPGSVLEFPVPPGLASAPAHRGGATRRAAARPAMGDTPRPPGTCRG